MNIIKTVDWEELPDALLTLAKAHMRVDGTVDDELVRMKLAGAIDWFERNTGVTVNPTTYAWTPSSSDFCCDAARIPETPVANLTAAIGATDATANYTVTTMSTKGVGVYQLNGAYAAGLVTTFNSGYRDQYEVPPGILDIVLRYATFLFEHRDILTQGIQVNLSPGWQTDAVATYWVPSV